MKGAEIDELTIRDRFAMAVMSGVLRCLMDEPGNRLENRSYLSDLSDCVADGSGFAEICYILADAMIEERKPKKR